MYWFVFRKAVHQGLVPAWGHPGYYSVDLGCCTSNISLLNRYCFSTEIAFDFEIQWTPSLVRVPAPWVGVVPVFEWEVPGKPGWWLIPVSPSSPLTSGVSLVLSSWTLFLTQIILLRKSTKGKMLRSGSGGRRRKLFWEVALGPTPMPDQCHASGPDPHRPHSGSR